VVPARTAERSALGSAGLGSSVISIPPTLGWPFGNPDGQQFRHVVARVFDETPTLDLL